MGTIWILGNLEDALGVVRAAKTLQEEFVFSVSPQPGCIPLRLADRPGDGLFSATPGHGILVSTAESQGICAYTGVPRDVYLLTASMLGILRYRCLSLNPLLREEDCLHESPSWCLCARRLFIEEFAIAFEAPRLCTACWGFYRSLCPPEEVAAARRVLTHAAALAQGAHPAAR